jgi:hypothetical protein
MSVLKNELAKIELKEARSLHPMRCVWCDKPVFTLSRRGIETVTGQTLFTDGDTVDLIHKKAYSLWKKRPYTLSVTAVWGDCPSCDETFYAIEIGLVDVDVAETFTDRYFDHNLPCSPKPIYELVEHTEGAIKSKNDERTIGIPWWFVSRYESEVGTVLNHVIGGWTARMLLEQNGLDATKYFNDAFMCRANTPAKYQITIQDLAGRAVSTLLPALYDLALNTRAKSLEMPSQTHVSENHSQVVPVIPEPVHYVLGIPN